MSNQKLSDLRTSSPAAPLDGAELVELTQGGSTVVGQAGDFTGVPIGVNEQTGTSYTPVRGDAGKDVRCNNAAAITFTIPPHSEVAFPVGTVLFSTQAGTGVVTAVGGTGVTLNSFNGYSTAGRYDKRGYEQVAVDVWEVI